MAWPVGMPLVTITQDVHKLPNGALPSSYAVHLQLSVPALVYDGQTTLIRRSITLTAEPGSGAISDQVPHLNHPDLSPTPVYYMVTEFADGQRVRDPWQLTPAAEDVTIDLDARAPIAGDPGTPVAVGPPGADGLPGLPGADGADGAPGADGEDGREVELQTTATHVQWRYVGDPTWTDLAALADLGAQTYDSLDDVDTTGLADGDAMVWDQSSGKWVRVSLSSTYVAPTGTDSRLQVDGVDVEPEQVGAASISSVEAISDSNWIGNGSPYGVLTPHSKGIEYRDLDQTNGARKWISTGTTNTSWEVTDGDTGWRRIYTYTSDETMWSAGTMDIRRRGPVVTLRFNSLTCTAGTGQAIAADCIPFDGWLPPSTTAQVAAGILATNAGPDMNQVAVVANDVYYRGPVGNSAATFSRYQRILRGTLSWETDYAWPEALPGTPA